MSDEPKSNIRSIDWYRKHGVKKDKSDDAKENSNFDDIVEANRKNKERVEAERLKANKKLVKDLLNDKGKK